VYVLLITESEKKVALTSVFLSTLGIKLLQISCEKYQKYIKQNIYKKSNFKGRKKLNKQTCDYLLVTSSSHIRHLKISFIVLWILFCKELMAISYRKQNLKLQSIYVVVIVLCWRIEEIHVN
jgi:hypothetical protein